MVTATYAVVPSAPTFSTPYPPSTSATSAVTGTASTSFATVCAKPTCTEVPSSCLSTSFRLALGPTTSIVTSRDSSVSSSQATCSTSRIRPRAVVPSGNSSSTALCTGASRCWVGSTETVTVRWVAPTCSTTVPGCTGVPSSTGTDATRTSPSVKTTRPRGRSPSSSRPWSRCHLSTAMVVTQVQSPSTSMSRSSV